MTGGGGGGGGGTTAYPREQHHQQESAWPNGPGGAASYWPRPGTFPPHYTATRVPGPAVYATSLLSVIVMALVQLPATTSATSQRSRPASKRPASRPRSKSGRCNVWLPERYSSGILTTRLVLLLSRRRTLRISFATWRWTLSWAGGSWPSLT
jgi:hypothetical protein